MKKELLILLAGVSIVTMLSIFAAVVVGNKSFKRKADWIKITDSRGQVWRIRKSDARAIAPDPTDTNIFRIWLSQGMTICVDFENRRQAEKLILETE